MQARQRLDDALASQSGLRDAMQSGNPALVDCKALEAAIGRVEELAEHCYGRDASLEQARVDVLGKRLEQARMAQV